jgi:jasmonate ZIM domain-containing protein
LIIIKPVRDMAAAEQQQLRQYMKEQGGNGALRLAPAVAMGLVPGADAAEGTEERKAVLELFPQQAGTLKDEQQRCVLQIASLHYHAHVRRFLTLKPWPFHCPLIRKRKEPADERAPLTIFYGGKMVVFDDFPAEKAEELMQLAGSSNAAAPGQNALAQPSLTGRN